MSFGTNMVYLQLKKLSGEPEEIEPYYVASS